MSHAVHRIVWKFDSESIFSEVICEADEPAPCRLTCDHGCEEWSEPYEVEGNWLHDIESYMGNVVATHVMKDMGYCGFHDWFADVEECAQGRQEFVIGEHPITTTWHGDHFRWTRVKEADQ